jgi:molybdopterin-guanine dinucleotide biosynthesis protein A
MISKENNMSSLNGLVLAGGKSKRMGTDKGKMLWHGKEQRYYMADMLGQLCEEVFISCRTDQEDEIEPEYQTLTDTFLNLGPYGGILTALRSQRDKAWLVIACDLPLLDEETIQFLIEHRNPKEMATTYKSPFDGLPEPLIAIWEPESYAVLLKFLEKGITCPRKVLINSDKTMLQAPNPDALMNANTPNDADKVKEILSTKKMV